MQPLVLWLTTGLLFTWPTSTFTTSTSKLQLGAKLAAEVPPDFLSVALDTGLAARHWHGLNMSSPRLLALTRLLRPATLRFGGTRADCVVFAERAADFADVAKCAPFQKPDTRPFELSTAQWLTLVKFAREVNMTLLFDVNSLLRNGDGRWNDTNARRLVTAMVALTPPLPIVWQLGNEPNSYLHKFNYSVSPEMLAQDFDTLRTLLGTSARLVGPDVNHPKADDGVSADLPVDMPAEKYLARFLGAGGAAAVGAVTFHQYYFNGRTATLDDFLDLRHFSSLPRQISAVRRAAGAGARLWLTETASAWGGGAPGLSDAFVSGFLWLDKLGVAAQLGVSKVVRQSLYGGHYALLDSHLQPNPDFWMSYLHKQLVGPRVLSVLVSGSASVRVYCHCGHRRLPPRAVTCFALNLSLGRQKLLLDARLRRGGLQYQLTADGGRLAGRGVRCNGLRLRSDRGYAPVLVPRPLPPAGSVSLPGYSITFFVWRRAAPAACWRHTKEE